MNEYGLRMIYRHVGQGGIICDVCVSPSCFPMYYFDRHGGGNNAFFSWYMYRGYIFRRLPYSVFFRSIDAFSHSLVSSPSRSPVCSPRGG